MSSRARNSSKHYVVFNGRKPGVYTSWRDAERQVKGFPNAVHRAYNTEREANEAYKQGLKRNPRSHKFSAPQSKKRGKQVSYASTKQLGFIESLRKQLGDDLFERVLDECELDDSPDEWTSYEASDVIDTCLEWKDTPRLKVEVVEQVKVAPLKQTYSSTLIADMQRLLDRVVPELRKYARRKK